MKISLKNIGKVKEADVEINALTVIAGANNTGKSTVGKALYSVFNGVSGIKEQERNERRQSLNRIIEQMISAKTDDMDYVLLDEKILNEIIDSYNKNAPYQDYYKILENLLFKFKNSSFFNSDTDTVKQNSTTVKQNSTFLNSVIKQLTAVLSISSHEIISKSIKRHFDIAFNSQISHLNYDELGVVKLSIKEKNTTVTFSEKSLTLENKLNLQTQAIYIDDPYILDNLSPWEFNRESHKSDLEKKLRAETKNVSIIDEILAEKKLDEIYAKLNSVANGSINRNGIEYTYQEKGIKEELKLANLSTGLKTFVIIKTLLQNGNIKEKSCLILDEPEIHLHPAWQLIFAELLILLQKNLNLHILLNTHSPYFLRAIQVYSAKHKIADKCKYYLASLKNNDAVINDVSEDIEQIYQSLATPLQILENEEWEVYESE